MRAPSSRAVPLAAVLVVGLGIGAGLRAQEGKPGAPPKTPAPAAAPRGQDGDIFAQPGQCGACHVDTGWDRLKAPPKEAFDHATTGFALRGAHAEVACESCHRRGLAALTSRCDTCHLDSHAGQNGTSCERCHNEQTWTVPRNIQVHERTRFPLTGAHAVVQCEACHRPRRAEPLAIMPLECTACHQREFRRARPNHVAAGFTECADCHTTTTFRGASYTHRVYILDGVHALQRCTACHTGAVFAGLAGSGNDCNQCHVSDFQRTATIGGAVPNHPASNFPTNCLGCHDNTRDTWDIAAVPG